MAAEARARWSVLNAALWGGVPSALLLVRLITLGEDPGNEYRPQTFAGEIVLHWLFAAGALAFVIGGLYTVFYFGDVNSGLAAAAYGGGFCLFAGRALRYIFAGE